MSWQPVDLREPPTATTASAVAGPVLDQTPGALAGADARLGAVQSRTRFVPSPLASPSAGIAGERSSLSDLLGRGCLALCVHPWTHGVAMRVAGLPATHGWLSPDLARDGLSAKLRDSADRRSRGIRECLAVIVSAAGYQSLADRLVRLNDRLPLPGLTFAERRARQLARLDTEQFERPVAPDNPRWQARRHLQTRTALDLRNRLGPLAATVEHYASDGDPVAELQSLISRRTRALDQNRQNWANFREQLNGGVGVAIFLRGDPVSIAGQLDETTLHLPSASLSALAALAGPADSLGFFREVLGL